MPAYHQQLLEYLHSTDSLNHDAVAELEVRLVGLTGSVTADAVQIWQYVSQHVLSPTVDFRVHLELARRVFLDWPVRALGRPPLWTPTPSQQQSTNIAKFMATFQGDAWWRAGRSGHPLHDWALLQHLSCQRPDLFWPPLLQHLGVALDQAPSRVLDLDPNPDLIRWFPGARLNIAASALACPRALPGQPALVWAQEGSPQQLHAMSREELRRASLHVAACIRARFQPGDAIAINMPMTAASVVIYLGIVLAGCAVISIADSFAPAEVEARLRIAGAKAIFTQDVLLRGGKALPLYSRVVEAQAPLAVVLPASTDATAACLAAAGMAAQPGPSGSGGKASSSGRGNGALRVQLRPDDLGWAQFLGMATAAVGQAFQAHIADAYETTNILFSSGTTGEPKAIPWTHLTPLRAGVDGWAMQDLTPHDTLAWPTNLGWMMGPWLLYAGLLNGATIALYQGAPLGRDFGEFVVAARVSVLGLVPSIVKAWRHSNCMQGLDLRGIKCFSSTGEASAPEDYHWLMALAGYRPVVEYIGGTEIGGAFMSSTLLHPASPSTFATPTLGAQLALLVPAKNTQAAASPSGRGPWAGQVEQDGIIVMDAVGVEPVIAELAVVSPLLFSSQHLLNRDHFKVYYADMPLHPLTGRPLRRHGDEMQRLPGGCFCALGRTDDTMNLGGIKVSSVEIERAVQEGVAMVAEAAAVGVPTPGGGPEQLVLFVVLKQQPAAAGSSSGSSSTVSSGSSAGASAGSSSSSSSTVAGGVDMGTLLRQCQEAVRSKLNPLFKVHQVLLRTFLPRTASNKVMRRVLRDELPRPKL